MALQELRVVDQGRRFAKLFGIFAMAIQELIESRQVPVRDVVAWGSLPVLRGRSLPVLRGCRLGGRRLGGRGLRGCRLRVRRTREPQQRCGSRTDN
jgi:hypothetical protein